MRLDNHQLFKLARTGPMVHSLVNEVIELRERTEQLMKELYAKQEKEALERKYAEGSAEQFRMDVLEVVARHSKVGYCGWYAASDGSPNLCLRCKESPAVKGDALCLTCIREDA